MKKQTAVEWLNAELERLTTRAGINMSWAMMDDLLKQAKEMERQQIIEAVIHGNEKPLMASPKMLAENYYNETYNNTNS